MSYKLLPCPFCGCAAEIVEERKCAGHGEFPKIGYVRCSICHASSGEVITDGFYGYTTTLQDAVELWNKRIPHCEPEQLAM